MLQDSDSKTPHIAEIEENHPKNFMAMKIINVVLFIWSVYEFYAIINTPGTQFTVILIGIFFFGSLAIRSYYGMKALFFTKSSTDLGLFIYVNDILLGIALTSFLGFLENGSQTDVFIFIVVNFIVCIYFAWFGRKMRKVFITYNK